MAIGTPYKTAQLAEQWDAIVIGSGMGGLTTAVLLARHAGQRVLVLERHYTAGGCTHTFHRPGFEWDVGLHYIGQMHRSEAVRRAFDHVTGRGVQWNAMPAVYDRVSIAGSRYDFPAGAENFRARLVEWFPAEVRAIDLYLKFVENANHSSMYYYAEKALPPWLSPFMGRSLRGAHLHWARQTTRQLLEGLHASPELIGVLTAQWGDYGLPPARSSFAVHATIVGHYLNGAAYPVGGASVIAAAMTPLIEQAGGAVVIDAAVEGIVCERGRAVGVRMADGREFRAKHIVSDAGVMTTYDRLLPADLPAVQRLRARLQKLAPSTAHLSLYVGLSQDDAALQTDPSNLWVYPSFDHDANVMRFEQDLDAPLPLVYLSFPSAKDPDFARRHPGKSTMEVITMAPYAPFARWQNTVWKHRDEAYESLKAALARRLRTVLEEQMPAVQGHIEHAELSTPLSTRHFLNSGHGEIYGLAATPDRYKLRQLGARTPVRSLYLTGQDVASPGVAGALFGGVIAASVVLGKNLMTKVVRE
jgi:all-trans-retinol 13,14-reductase